MKNSDLKRYCFLLLYLLLFFGPLHLRAQEEGKSHSLRVGVYNNPPKIFVNEEGKADGIFIDLLEVIAEREDFELEYATGDWNELKQMLSEDRIDLLPDVAYSRERDSLYNLNTVPVLSSWLEAYTLKNAEIRSLADFKNRRIGVLKGSVQEEFFDEFAIKNLKLDFKKVTYDDYPSSIEGLYQKEIDVLVASRFLYFTKHINGEITSTGIIFRPSELHLAFSRSLDPAVVFKIDRQLSALKNDPRSEYYSIIHFWFDPPENKSLPSYFWWILYIVLFLLLSIIGFLFLLRYQVKLKTQALWKRNRQLTQAKEKAEEHERLKTIFLQNMSHEIRTPMNGIIGFLELLKEPNLDSDTRTKYIDIVIKSGKRLLTTINNIIEISKIDTHQLTVHPGRVNIPEVMEFYYNFFLPQAKEKNIELKLFQNLDDSDGIIETDKFIFDNILTNLIGNAIKFTDHGYIEIGNYKKGKDLVFYIKDTGVGIPPERQKAIFKRFVQANLSITRPHEGSGLGLAIVKAYVKALQGKIWLESEENRGTTFFFTLPYRPVDKEAVSNNNNHDQEVTSKPLDILIAEDDNISFLFINQILKRPEIKITRARSGKECVELLRKNPNIDLVLMDIKMPVMNGIEATKEIRTFNQTVPIIVQTAYTSSGDKEKALEAGCNDYITKPIDKERLLQLIRKYT
ncbi:Signal transduction histidine kinase [Salinimicrobium catena]|uniref:histidine kinase n=1 Tax=Salinimicrobium catena TaxID=390640 RepID=A0A1H5KZS4_9FLAO|nr:response regulator [Salinimicrobium catena]SDL03993.1 Signal transduction histidine kinase [Salinimicrobium catena]SEE70369.1 Signal transduction histidine kinase [Salinimicrobium catena]